ncbi:sulfite oxidase [Bacillus sp. V3B]|uniref:sulfite oxidase n=1 Tax=Bacillus sp. V3B TaxID=2804915 RepID=UPI00210BC146|nr:sulfite oxidase [Bacillus sp. V3B]MCQ6275215.1 sulfite oxidase [Bacillus sp. V3B]
MEKKRITPYLITKSLNPENQESPIHFLTKWKIPTQYFYRRNHFSYPFLTHSNYWLQITGHVDQPSFFHYLELLSMPAQFLFVPIECAGNKRANFTPKVYGEQWEEGAISQGKWTGVPLGYLLEKVGISKNTQEIIFEGADFGKRTDMEDLVHFERSLPLDKALHPDTIIAYQYNDKPLSFKHGYPLRLIVPNWYGMASVKWLRKIKIIEHNFQGPFQTVDYIYYPNKHDDEDKTPVTVVNVNSTIQQPLNLSILSTGIHKIEGIAWTGQGSITEVQLSFDKGQTWKNAKLEKLPYESYAWSNWSFNWKVEKAGEYTIYSRAKDSNGRIQPLTAFWNRKGYGYNAVSKINLKVE